MGLKPKAIARVGNRFILVPFPSLLGSATAPPEIPSGPPSPSWTLDFSTGEPWSNGTNYTFSSTASTSRTFVNSSGYVALCVANLLQRSQDLANGYWTKTDSSIGSTSITAPDGTSTADELVENTANSSHNCLSGFTPVSGTTYTLTVYAKANTRSIVYLTGLGLIGAGKLPQFDLSAGTDVSVGTGMTTSITSVGSGWYRCRVTYTATGTGSAGFGILNAVQTTTNISYLGDGSSSAYFWGAQIVTGADALPYSATTGSSNGIPRLTHNSSGQRLGLLMEPQRTNLFPSSQELNDAAWSTTVLGAGTATGTITANDAVSPSNSTNAEKFTDNSSVTPHGITDNISVTSGTTYTVTIYAKAGTESNIQIGGRSAAFGLNEWANFNLSTGTVGTVGTGVTGSDATIESVGNGWYRCKLTMPCTTNHTGGFYFITLDGNLSARAPSYVGTGKTVFWWGFQAEAASTATSYIPTTNASVTREADIAYLGAVTNFGRPGSFVVEYYKPIDPNGHVLVAEDDVGSGGRLGLAYSSGGPRIIFGTTSTGSGGTDTAGLNKVGWAWDGSGAATRSAINGAAWDTSLATSFDPSTVTSIGLGGNVSDPGSLPITVSEQPNVIVRKITFYNSQLSAADLNTLTT